jgi:hypothetical protein
VVPVHPEAAAFAAHYGFTIIPLAAYRPTGKGRVERQVLIVREHVLAARSFTSLADLDAAFATWLPTRRAEVHRTHGEVIAVRAEADRAALRSLPELPYLVCDRHLRRVGKDCLVSFEASCYSVPARRGRAGQRVEVRASQELVAIHALVADDDAPTLLAVHRRAARRGSWVVDQAHWDGLPDGTGRSTVTEPLRRPADCARAGAPDRAANPLAALLSGTPAADIPVARRALADYQSAAGLPPCSTAGDEPEQAR